MGRYLLRRLLHLGPVLLGVSLIVFVVLHLTPGDPAEVMLGSQATREDLSRLRAERAWVIKAPLATRRCRFAPSVVTGFGRTVSKSRH